MGPDDMFSDVLRRYRMSAGMTQEELAERAGLSARGISDLERGRRSRPYFETVRLLASALELGDEDRAALFASARGTLVEVPRPTIEEHSTHLPSQLTSFVGRESERRIICEVLQRDTVRLVTLTGAGGVGKTRLALQIAAEMRAAFDDRVYFVPLASLRDHNLVLATIAHGMGLTDTSNEPPLARLIANLRGKRALLILDNLEHLLDATPAINELLIGCPDLSVLATSRAALSLSGEHEFVVPPLELPEPNQSDDLTALMRFPAVALLLDRLSMNDPGLTLSVGDVAAITEICRRTDGLPLAIELAAARNRHMTLQELASRLRHRLDLLARGPRDLPHRQRALRDTIAWSYELLGADEQRLMRWLAVFSGGWALASVEALCRDEDDWRINVVDGLATLIESSLVQITRGVDGLSRYDMLDTIREFAEEALAETGESHLVHERHAAMMMAYAEQSDRGLRSGARTKWTRNVAPEVENVRAALRWLLDQDETERALVFIGNLLWFWDAVSRGREGRTWGEEALAKPNADPQSWSYARASYVTGQQAWAMGDLVAASRLLSHSAERFRALGDRRSLGQTLDQLGSTYLSKGDLDAAQALLSESAELLDNDDYRWDYGLSIFMLGDVMSRTDPEAARRCYEMSLEAFRTVGDPFGMAIPITGLGGLAMRERDYATARALFEEGLALRRAAGHTFNTAISLTSLGELSRYEGDVEGAQDYLEQSLKLFRDLGDAERMAWTLYNLSMVAIQTGNLLVASDALRESLSLRLEHGSEAQVSQTLAGLSQVALLSGKADCAARLLGMVEVIRTSMGIAMPKDEDGEAEQRCRQQAKTILGAQGFEAALADGLQSSRGEAIRLAFELAQNAADGHESTLA